MVQEVLSLLACGNFKIMDYQTIESLPLEAVIVNMLVPGLGYFLLAGCAYFIFYKSSNTNLLALKIQKDFPANKLVKKEIFHSIRTILIWAVGGALIVIAAKNGYTRIYTDIGQYGWAYLAVCVVGMVIIHDAYFYWAHRLMHHPMIYKYTHVTHHKFTNPTPWSAFTFGPIEAVLQFGIIPLFVFIIPLHWSAIAIFIVNMIAINVLGHLGFELFSRKYISTWFGNWSNTATHHNIHHVRVKYNFGLYFIFWDRWMKTEERINEI